MHAIQLLGNVHQLHDVLHGELRLFLVEAGIVQLAADALAIAGEAIVGFGHLPFVGIWPTGW